MTRQPPVANEVQQRAAIESDVCQLAVVEFHQPVEVTPNDASVRDLLEQSLGEPAGRTFPMCGAGPESRGRPLPPQPLAGKGDHLAKNIGVGGLLHERAKAHHQASAILLPP